MQQQFRPAQVPRAPLSPASAGALGRAMELAGLRRGDLELARLGRESQRRLKMQRPSKWGAFRGP